MLPRCVFGLPAMAISRRGAFPVGDPWQLFHFMRSRRGLGREKRPLPGNISPPCIQNELALARYARHASEKPRKRAFGDAPREYPAMKTPFSLRAPLRSCTARGSCHSWVLRLSVLVSLGRGGGGARGSRTVPVCAEWHGCFAGSPHAAPSCPPLTRRMLLLSRPPSRETCLLPPPCEVAYIPRRPTRGKRIRLASAPRPNRR